MSGSANVAVTVSGPSNTTGTRLQTESRRQAWRKLNTLMDLSGLDTLDKLSAWLEGPLFGTHFEELANDFIIPAQDEAARLGHKKKQGPNLKRVQETLIDGERGGKARYSDRRINKEDWDEDDHYAFFLWNVRHVNSKINRGIFYGKGKTEAEVDSILWMALQRESYRLAPSKRQARADAERKRQERKTKMELRRLAKASKKRKTGKTGVRQSKTPSREGADASKRVEDSSSDHAAPKEVTKTQTERN